MKHWFEKKKKRVYIISITVTSKRNALNQIGPLQSLNSHCVKCDLQDNFIIPLIRFTIS